MQTQLDLISKQGDYYIVRRALDKVEIDEIISDSKRYKQGTTFARSISSKSTTNRIQRKLFRKP
jgi:hypothetical protein